MSDDPVTNMDPDRIEQLVTNNSAAIAFAAAEAAMSKQPDPVILLVDLEGAEEGDLRVAEFFKALPFGPVAVAPIAPRHARGLVCAAVADPTRLASRLDEEPPAGHVHVLVLSRVFGRVALTFARVARPPIVFAA